MSTAAAPAPLHVAPVPTMIDDRAALERELTLARIRNRTMFRALNNRAGRTLVVVGVFGRGVTVDHVVHTARIAESLGEVPAIRFIRDAAGSINGIELALLEHEPDVSAQDECEAGFRILAQMAVIGGDD